MGWTRRVVNWFRDSEGYWSVAGLLLGVLASKVSWLAWATPYAWVAAASLVAWALARRLWRRLSRGQRLRPRRTGDAIGAKVYWGVLSTLVGAALPALGIEKNLAPWALGLSSVVLVPGLVIWASWLWKRHRPARRWRWQDGRDGNPYPLLTPYEDDRAPVFFGREIEADAVVARVQSAQDWQSRFIPVVGRSGVGKSSIVRAGVLPRLNSVAPRPFSWLVDFLGGAQVLGPVTPDDRSPVRGDGEGGPLQTLASLLAGGDADVARAIVGEARQLGEAAQRGEPGPVPAGLLGVLARRRGWRPRLVIVIDQMEQAAKPGNVGETELLAYLSMLKAALIHDSKTVVVATVRADLLGRLLGGPAADLFEDPVMVRPMDRTQLLRVIHGPADAAGIHLDTTLIDGKALDSQMLDDVAGDDALALLSFGLHQMWDAEATFLDDGWLRRSEYDKIGGARALSSHADAAVERLVRGPLYDLPPTVARALVLDTLLEAVALVEAVNQDGYVAVKRRFPKSELTPRQLDVVKELAHPEVGVLVMGDPVEISHEVLLRRWGSLADHIKANRDALVLRSRIEPMADTWNNRDRQPELLLRGSDLRAAGQFPLLQQGLLGAYIAASTAAVNDENERLADAAANHALAELDREPERAMRTARAAASYALTWRVHTALYRACHVGNRGNLTGHDDAVFAVSWSPDGSRLASAGKDHTIRLWWADGTPLARLDSHTRPVFALSWSPDGGRLASAGDDGVVRLWSADGVPLAALTGYAEVVRALAWSPDGKRLASAELGGRSVWLWSVESGSLSELAGHTDRVLALAWSPDGTQLASASLDETVRLWSADGAPLSELRGHSDRVLTLAWSPDGNRLASAGNDHTVRLWSSDGTALSELVGHHAIVTGVSWSPDGNRLASVGEDFAVRLWSVDGTAVAELVGQAPWRSTVAWSPDGARLASAGNDRTVRLWSADGAPLAKLTGHTEPVLALSWSPDGNRLASAGNDRTVRLWSADGVGPAELAGFTGQMRALAWSPDGKRLASAALLDRSIRVWSIDGAALTEMAPPHDPGAESVADQPRPQFVPPSDPVLAVAWSPDGARLASGSMFGMVRLWSADGVALCALAGHTDPVLAVAWSPDGNRFASAGSDHTIRLWSSDGTPLGELTGHTDKVFAVAWSPDGNWLASAGLDGTVRLWSADGAALANLPATGSVAALAWSPDGTWLASGVEGGMVRLWPMDGTAPTDLVGFTDSVNALAWSPDGIWLASGGEGGTVRLWPMDGAAPTELIGHTASVNALAWSPDGTRLTSADIDGTVRQWLGPFGFDDLISLLDNIPGLGELNDEERRLASLPALPPATDPR